MHGHAEKWLVTETEPTVIVIIIPRVRMNMIHLWYGYAYFEDPSDSCVRVAISLDIT